MIVSPERLKFERLMAQSRTDQIDFVIDRFKRRMTGITTISNRPVGIPVPIFGGMDSHFTKYI